MPNEHDKTDSSRSTGHGGSIRSLTIWQILIFLVLIIAGARLVDEGLRVSGLDRFRPAFVATGAYGIVIIGPLVYAFSPQLLTKRYWRLPPSAWKAVCAVAILQFCLNYLPGNALTKYGAVSALIFSPTLEEMIRAVLICPLSERWGASAAILSTSLLFALAHPYPVNAMLMQTALAIIFVSTGRSISAAVLAHLVANALVVLHYGIASP